MRLSGITKVASNRIPRVRTIDPHTIAAGGPDFLEMIRFSNKTWIWIKCLTLPFRHRITSLVVIVILATMIFEGAKWYLILMNLILAITIMAAALYTYTYIRYAYAPNFTRLTQAIRRRWKVHKRWPLAVKAAGFNTSRKLRKVKYTPNGMVGTFKTNEGHNSQDLQAGADDIAAVLGANEVKVDASVPFEAKVSIIWGDPTDRILFPEDISELQSGDEDRVTFALDADHQPLEISITTSVLIIGESESGKSNCFWSILNGLNEKGIDYKLWVADPAGGVELDALEASPNTVSYAATISEISEVISGAYSAMEERLRLIKGNDRKYRRSSDFPLNILVIDELLLLPRWDQQSELGKILSSGRKAGFIVIGLSQLSQVDALGRTRDLFPQRICHATKSQEMTDAALGSGAEAAGANCSKISKRTPGVGYYFSLQTRLYTRFRTPLISDSATKIIASGHLIQRTITNDPIKSKFRKRLGRRRTSLYRYYGEYEGELGRLLYVGIAYNPKDRWDQHCNDPKEPWCPRDIDNALTEIEWFASRQEAKKAETEAIREERPVYNKQERIDY
jgi:predicted GIY-YIG superfamily endonuclease